MDSPVQVTQSTPVRDLKGDSPALIFKVEFLLTCLNLCVCLL